MLYIESMYQNITLGTIEVTKILFSCPNFYH